MDADWGLPIDAVSNLGLQVLSKTEASWEAYVTFRLNFHHFDHLELDLRGRIRVRGMASPVCA